MSQAVGFLVGVGGYSFKVLRELPPQAGKLISEGVEAVWKSGQISACSFRQPRDGPGTGGANLPNTAQEHRCSPREKPAFPRALGSRGSRSLGGLERCDPLRGLLRLGWSL